MSYGSDSPGGASEGVGGSDTSGFSYGGGSAYGMGPPTEEQSSQDFGNYMDAVSMGPPTQAQQQPLNDQFAQDFNSYSVSPYGTTLGQMYSNPTDARLASSMQEAPTNPESSFLNSKLWGALKNVGLFAARATPLGQVANLANLGYNAYNGAPIGATIGGMVGGLPGAVAGLGVDAATGKNVSGQAGGMAGSVLGNSIAPGLGGLVGGMIGSEAAQGLSNRGTSMGETQTAGVTSPSSGGLDMNSVLQGLGGLYSASQGSKAADQNLQSLQTAQQQMPSLDSMFGPNSAAYQRMQQELAAKDAAGGRRSQYGPRSVELQARMAGLMGQYGPGMLNSQTSNLQQQQNAILAQNNARNQNLNALLTFGKQAGVGDYLQGLWNRNVTPTDMSGFYSSNNPSWQPSTSTDMTGFQGNTNYMSTPGNTPWQPMDTSGASPSSSNLDWSW